MENSTKKELIKESKQLRLFYHFIPTSTFIWKKDGDDFVLLKHNKSAIDYAERKKEYIIGVKASEFYSEDIQILRRLKQCYQQKSNIRDEIINSINTTKESKHFGINYIYIAPDLIMVQIEDIIERKLIEESNILCGKIIQESKNEIYLFEEDSFRFVELNKSAIKNIGYTMEEILQLTPVDIKPEYDINSFKKLLIPLREQKEDKTVFYTNHLRKDGTSYPIEVQLQLIKFGDKQYFAAIILDITERKKIETELLESYNIINASPIVVFLWGGHENWNTKFVTKNVINLLGYSAEEFLKNKISFKDLIHPEDFERVDKELIKYHKTKQKEKLIQEYRVITKSGSIKWVRDFPSLVRESNKNVTYFHAVLQDITLLKMAEMELQGTNSLLSSILESPENIIMFALDRDYNYLSFNQAHAKEMQNKYDAEIEIGQHIFSYISNKEDQQQIIENYKKVLNGEKIVKIQAYGQLANRQWYELFFNPIFDHSNYVTGFSVFATNITEQVLTKEKIQNERKKFKDLFEKSVDALLIINNSIFTECNDSTIKMLGYSSEKEFLNVHPSKLSPMVQPDGKKSFEKAEEMMNIAIERGSHRFEWIHTKKNGVDFPVEVVLTLISKEPNNNIIYCVLRDITKRKLDEEELEKYRTQLETENIYLKEEISLAFNYEDMVYSSIEISEVLTLVEQVATTDATVLVLGETGTGKELIAKAIHNTSERKNKSLIRVNCAAIPSELLESELFGHTKGSFTGAIKNRIGKFELANGGTLFLDEIGELPVALQPKLLRAIQEGEIEPIGSTEVRKLDIRIVAATNKDLNKEIEEKRFREDLYFRLNVFPVTVPPLRERIEDIPVLIDHFVKKYSIKHGKEIKHISDLTLQQMKSYAWPGNVRELENVIERAVIISNHDLLVVHEFDSSPQSKTIIKHNSNALEEVQSNHILKILIETNWKIDGKEGAAVLLDIKPSTLRDRMKKFGIKRTKT